MMGGLALWSEMVYIRVIMEEIHRGNTTVNISRISRYSLYERR